MLREEGVLPEAQQRTGCSVLLRQQIAAPSAIARSRESTGPEPSSQHRGSCVGQVPSRGKTGSAPTGQCSPLPATPTAKPPGQTTLDHARTQPHLRFCTAERSSIPQSEGGRRVARGCGPAWLARLHFSGDSSGRPRARHVALTLLSLHVCVPAAGSTGRPAHAAEPAFLGRGIIRAAGKGKLLPTFAFSQAVGSISVF